MPEDCAVLLVSQGDMKDWEHLLELVKQAGGDLDRIVISDKEQKATKGI